MPNNKSNQVIGSWSSTFCSKNYSKQQQFTMGDSKHYSFNQVNKKLFTEKMTMLCKPSYRHIFIKQLQWIRNHEMLVSRNEIAVHHIGFLSRWMGNHWNITIDLTLDCKENGRTINECFVWIAVITFVLQLYPYLFLVQLSRTTKHFC